MSDPLRAAMVRFPTLEPACWPAVVRSLCALGFTAIDVPLVWREHERSAGDFDFSSERLAVGAFLDVVAGEGLRAVVRLGPMCGHDAPGLGLPERVLGDRACQARTRRQNPVLVPDPPRLAPLPSLASRAFRRESLAWIEAACRALEAHATRGTIARWLLGPTLPATWRDDPYEMDHHPDALGDLVAVPPPHAGPRASAQALVDRQTEHVTGFLMALRERAVDGGAAPADVALGVPGGAMASTVLPALAGDIRVVLAAPPAQVDPRVRWRQLGYALSFPHAIHLDLAAGAPPWEPAVTGHHAVQAARLALAAGARDTTVRMGCAGDRWVGALLDARGRPRAGADAWTALHAWAATLPRGTDLTATLVTPVSMVAAARAATGVHPLPLGLLALLGWLPGELAAEGAAFDRSEGLEARERRLLELETSLTARGLPWRRGTDLQPGPLVLEEGTTADLVAHAQRALSAVAPVLAPAGGALVRVVQTDDATHLVLVSIATADTRAELPPGPWYPDNDATPDTVTTVTLAPGEARILVQPRPRAGGPS